MEKVIGTVYAVSKVQAKGSTKVGDYESLELAKAAMLKHFQTNAKRGTISYHITLETISEYDSGFRTRTWQPFSPGSSYIFHRPALDALCVSV